ncbi:MAG: PSD1 and planctomycete cytochrome C domain-containing protein [Gemmataceae bacterium]
MPNDIRRLRSVLVLLAMSLLALTASVRSEDKKEQEKKLPAAVVEFFESKVRPVLAEQCLRCHGEKKQKGNLRLDSRAGLLSGGDQGPAMVPGQPEKSLLVKAIHYGDTELRMPPSRKLSAEQIKNLEQWIKMGAPWPGADPEAVVARKGDREITAKDREYWAYRPVKRPAVPEVADKKWMANPIDAFIGVKLQAAGLQPNPPAGKRELVRRVYYDLIGLPPTPAEVDAFVNDTSPKAYENLIDRLLASPHYGEKWGRHWLDLVRFAETNGYERDGPKQNVWRYRDYVIQAFNKDKPFDRFVLEQLAGDELPDADEESITATGYYRLGLWDDEPVDRLQAYYDGLDDVVSTTSQVFLGLTMGCARCHAHKIDPVQNADYYKLLAFFHNLKHGNTQVPIATPAEHRAHEQRLAKHKGELERLETAIAVHEQKVYESLSNPEKDDAKDRRTRDRLIAERCRKVLTPDELKDFFAKRTELDRLRKSKVPGLPAVLGAEENGRNVPETFVLVRGSAHVKGPKVEPGFPTVLTPPSVGELAFEPTSSTSGRRLVLAKWIASASNPLTTRVLANRLWQHHFGRGIVESSNDFGKAGTPPTHPELLDWLASEIPARGWRLKAMHKLILMSNTYRMSSAGNPKALAQDPTNRLFWRFDMRRLTAEEIRDSILSVTGTLNLKMHGPSVFPPLPREVIVTASNPAIAWGKSSPEDAARRSVYVYVKRSLRPPILMNFDAPDTDSSSAVRFTTTVPTQALGLLNSQFAGEQAALLAKRLDKEARSTADKVTLAIRLTTGRVPSTLEVAEDAKLIESLQKEEGLSAQQALVDYCLMMLNTNEFIYLD